MLSLLESMGSLTGWKKSPFYRREIFYAYQRGYTQACGTAPLAMNMASPKLKNR